MKRSKSLAEYEGMLVHLVIQARATGLGWVTCDYAHDHSDATAKADELAESDSAWMPDTAALPPAQRRLGFVRIISVGQLPYGTVRHAIEEHNRRRNESVNTCY